MVFSRQNKFFFILAAFSFGLGALTTLYLQNVKSKSLPYRKTIAELRGNTSTESKYSLIKPLLACETTFQSTRSQFSRILKPRLAELIEQAKQDGQAAQISIYFDTRDGRWFSINAEEKYFPASLLKVPIMMAFFKLSESQPDILEKEVAFSATEDSYEQQYFPPTHSLKIGESHTIEKLIERMIRFSDNDALNVLLENLPALTPLEKIFIDLGLPFPNTNQNKKVDFMEVKSYAYLFRVLYNASYLSDHLSERAMALLANTDFKHGITTLLPSNLIVAHKFGEHTLANSEQNETVQELHDCGIVYYPQQPYLLCIMTKGGNPDILASQIQRISKTVYDFMKTELQPE